MIKREVEETIKILTTQFKAVAIVVPRQLGKNNLSAINLFLKHRGNNMN